MVKLKIVNRKKFNERLVEPLFFTAGVIAFWLIVFFVMMNLENFTTCNIYQ